MVAPHELLFHTALGITIRNRIHKDKLDELEEERVTFLDKDPCNGCVEVKLVYKDGSTDTLTVRMKEFNKILFTELFDIMRRSDEYDYSSEWHESWLPSDPDCDFPIFFCKKCEFPAIHKFDYCPHCGRKMIDKEK